MRIKLWESFTYDNEMIFIYLSEEGIEIKFGETENTKYVDIIKTQTYGNKSYLGSSFLVLDPILNWVDMNISDNDDWYLETKGSNSSILNGNNNIWSKEYLKDLLCNNTDIRVIIKENQINIESLFKPYFKDFYINHNHKEKVIYITKKFDYTQERYSRIRRREVRITYEDIISPYSYPGVYNLNLKQYNTLDREPETYKKIYANIVSCVEKLPEDMRNRCELTIRGKNHIELSLFTRNLV